MLRKHSALKTQQSSVYFDEHDHRPTEDFQANGNYILTDLQISCIVMRFNIFDDTGACEAPPGVSVHFWLR